MPTRPRRPPLSRDLIALGQGLRAAEAVEVFIYPLLPRTKVRGFRPETYDQRRRFVNRLWASRFRSPPITLIDAPADVAMLGRDGVHLSPSGQRAVMDVARHLLMLRYQSFPDYTPAETSTSSAGASSLGVEIGAPDNVRAFGIPGGRLGCADHRRRLLRAEAVVPRRILILGSSHGKHMARALAAAGAPDTVRAFGIPGGRLGCPEHRRRLLRAAADNRPMDVLLVIGGNDLCQRDLDVPQLSRDLIALGQGLRAAGAVEVFVYPVLPRTRVRGVCPATYEQRRRFLNRVWASRFRSPPITLIDAPADVAMLGRDGVHLSPSGQRAVMDVARHLLMLRYQSFPDYTPAETSTSSAGASSLGVEIGAPDNVRAFGIPGGRLGCADHRRRLLRAAADHR
ncbi:hypothetical protein FJT64_019742 [Amphibalanus amphitrite]|uniref:SGNH hydrolase-type esterase domain-containing protein n=1 Tax=Amphibalanus amphitrite TaxID=1232801 RepID=A0A6A4WZC1_AMPAM|nr:hypothetical protein FJT64_019742 [Amphibalanus amphitrite]